MRVHLIALLVIAATAPAAEIRFRHHSINWEPPPNASAEGDYGLTALADIDRDGDLDFVLGGRIPPPERLYWLEFQAAGNWIRHEVGTGYESDVGLAALDVDGDDWVDLVCSGVWFRNPGNPRESTWERIPFASNARGAHDIVAADIDGDGRQDIVMMRDARTPLNALCWFKIPADPREPWQRHDIGPGIHGAIAPAGVADINGDGHTDIVCGDTWLRTRAATGASGSRIEPFPWGAAAPTAFACAPSSPTSMRRPKSDRDVRCGRSRFQDRHPEKSQRQGRSLDQAGVAAEFSLRLAPFAGRRRFQRRRPARHRQQRAGGTAAGRNPRWIVWENLGEQRFVERVIRDDGLGGHELQAGDVEGDGDIDIVSKPWGSLPWNAAGGKMHIDFMENLVR